jgi:hypothetical protein
MRIETIKLSKKKKWEPLPFIFVGKGFFVVDDVIPWKRAKGKMKLLEKCFF